MMPVSPKTAAVIPLHRTSPDDWDPACVEALIRDLAGVEEVTEQHFLELGQRINTLHRCARDISQSATDALTLLNGEGGETTLQHLQLLVERCHLWLQATEESSQKVCQLLRHLLQQVAALEGPVLGLRKVVKTLHSLRVSTRIEAAKGYASGAAVLARSLDELGNLVQAKVREIFDRTETLVPVIDRSLSLEEQVRSGSIALAGEDVQKARQMLGDFLNNCLATGQWTDRLKSRSDGVAGSFGEIIAALQFQDITRQRLEHVQRALGNLQEHLEQYRQHRKQEKDAKAERLFGAICRLQHDQLDFAAREFTTAADNLVTNLREMSGNVVAMAGDTRELMRMSDDGRESRYTTVLTAMQSIAGHLGETGDIHQQACRNLVHVTSGVEKVSQLVEEVEYIGEEMQLVAINAAISAAHARQRGAGLDVIARNIQEVAEEACTHALDLARHCQSIAEHSRQLKDIEATSQAETDGPGDLLADAKQRMANLRGSHTDLVDLAGRVDHDADGLARDVAEIVERFEITRAFLDQLAPVKDRLQRLGTLADSGLDAEDDTSLEQLFRELELCYTMASERQIHESFTGSRTSSSTTAADDEDVFAEHRHHDLGDNVDLF